MPHRVPDPLVPQAGPYRLSGQGLHGRGADEAGRRFGHGDAHVRAGLDEQARQLGGLVGRDAAGDPQQDFLARQRHAPIRRLGGWGLYGDFGLAA
jgi:hypothetical protein